MSKVTSTSMELLLQLLIIAITVNINVVSAQSTSWWKPEIGQSLQWKLAGTLSYTFEAAIYDSDLDNGFDVSQVHAAGRKAVCYINVGSLEDDPNFRPDFSSFPSSILGEKYPGWDERFIDIRSATARSLILARLQRAAQAGCDAVEPDNTDTYTEQTGFPLTSLDALDYIKWIAGEAHGLGMGVALKNGVSLVAEHGELIDAVDFALGFIDAGKPVFEAEYLDVGEGGCDAIGEGRIQEACAKLNGLNMEGFITDCGLSLDVSPVTSETGSEGTPSETVVIETTAVESSTSIETSVSSTAFAPTSVSTSAAAEATTTATRSTFATFNGSPVSSAFKSKGLAVFSAYLGCLITAWLHI
ncbi:glycoside hydrolase superfamily [Chytridium lagenaria]|nr:glycoside hydrolase superfamily [Chytridium lagenaria]